MPIAVAHQVLWVVQVAAPILARDRTEERTDHQGTHARSAASAAALAVGARARRGALRRRRSAAGPLGTCASGLDRGDGPHRPACPCQCGPGAGRHRQPLRAGIPARLADLRDGGRAGRERRQPLRDRRGDVPLVARRRLSAGAVGQHRCRSMASAPRRGGAPGAGDGPPARRAGPALVSLLVRSQRGQRPHLHLRRGTRRTDGQQARHRRVPRSCSCSSRDPCRCRSCSGSCTPSRSGDCHSLRCSRSGWLLSS